MTAGELLALHDTPRIVSLTAMIAGTPGLPTFQDVQRFLLATIDAAKRVGGYQ